MTNGPTLRHSRESGNPETLDPRPRGGDGSPDRRSAWEDFLKEGEPSRSSEEWRRIRFSQWGLDKLQGPGDRGQGAENGIVSVLTPDPSTLPPGVVALSLEEALKEPLWRDLILNQDGFAPKAGPYRKLETANAACWRGGAFVYVPKGFKVDAPIRLRIPLNVTPAKAGVQRSEELGSRLRGNDEPMFSFPRVVVVAEEGSSVSIVEDYENSESAETSAQSEAAFSSLFVGAAASVRYFYVQDRPAGTVHFWNQRCRLEKGASLEHLSVLLGGRLHKSDLSVTMAGSGATAELAGTLFGFSDQNFEFYSHQLHKAPQTSSRLFFDAALAGRARSNYRGLIRIEENGKDAEAYQTNRNLLLSDKARADTTPILEILTDSVHCKHGATAGALSDDELFYAQTRGFDPSEAKRLLVEGFFAPLLSKVPVEDISARLDARIAERIKGV